MALNDIKTNIQSYLTSIKTNPFNEDVIRNYIYQNIIKPVEVAMNIFTSIITPSETDTELKVKVLLYYPKNPTPENFIETVTK